MHDAVEEAVELNDSNREIDAAFDESWQKRDHNFLNGVVTTTTVTTCVLNCEILSKYSC